MPVLTDLLALFDPTLPLERARTIPASWYTDPTLFAYERSRVFGATWQAVGRHDQCSSPGDYFTADVAGTPVVIVCDETGVLRAFVNICRHRGARVACAPQGHATRWRCRYHGWTYDLSGGLRGTPEFDGVADFARSQEGLPPLPVFVWGPFVFVHLGGQAPSAPPWIAALEKWETANRLRDMQFHERRTYDLACNWKVFVDNYLDGGYHVNTIHPSLAGVLDYSQYRTELHEEANVQISPLRTPDSSASSAAAVRTGDAAFYWWLFPNFMINVYAGVLDTNLVVPLGPERCRVVMDFYFSPALLAGTFAAESIAVAEQIQAEDIAICEDVQRGLASGRFDTGRFSVRREAGGYQFQQLLHRALARTAPV